MLSVVFVLAATLTLLPAVLGQARPARRQALAALGALRRAPLAALRRLGRAAVAPARCAFGALAARRPARARAAGARAEDRHAVDQGRARAATARASATPRSSRRFGPGAPGALQIVAPQARRRARRRGRAGRPAASRRSCRPMPGARRRASLVQAVPNADPSSKAVGATVDRLRADAARRARWSAAPSAENHDLEAAAGGQDAAGHRRRPRARLPAAAGRPAGAAHRRGRRRSPTCSPTGAAFGVARLIFQEGHLAGLLGFEPQGFLDAWGPVFFFAMIFAISMDYTVFLLSSRQGALGPQPRPEGGDGRRRRALRPRHLRRRAR